MKKHRKEGFAKELISAIKHFNPGESEKYLGVSFRDFSKKKKELLEQIKRAQNVK